MYLPWMRYSARIPEYEQVRFSGIDRNKASGDGTIFDMRNITTDDFPVMSATPNRKIRTTAYDKPWFYGSADKEYVIAGEFANFENETWESGKAYNVGDIAGYNGLFYIVIKNVSENSDASQTPPTTNAEYWSIYSNITFTYEETWNYWHTVRVGDVVNFGNRYFRSKTGRNIMLYNDTSNWRILRSGEYPDTRGTYDGDVKYTMNDIVYYNGEYYRPRKDTQGNLPTNAEYWKLVTWNYSSSYEVGDCVIFRPPGKYYYRLQKINTAGNTSPANDTANWEPYTYASFYYDNQLIEGLHLSPGRKECAYLNGHIVIIPDNIYYKVDDGSFGYLKGTKSGKVDTRNYRGIYYNGKKFDYPMVGVIENETAMNKITLGFFGGNTIMPASEYSTLDLTKVFRSGDAVDVNQIRQNSHEDYAIIRNGTYYVDSVTSDSLTFTTGAFSLIDIGENAAFGSNEKYLYLGDIILSKGLPDLDFLCVSNNRMWGCHEDTVYSSALGDVFIWQKYSGVETDPVYIESGDLGSFTGCIEYNGYPVFFKEHEMYRVYGSTASTFALQKVADYGLRKDSPHAVSVVDSVLFFLSPEGICAYTGGVPAVISDNLRTDLSEGAFVSADKKLYASVRDNNGRVMYVYDTDNRIWSSETFEDMPLGFAKINGEQRMMNSEGNLVLIGKTTSEWQNEADTEIAYIEFNDFYGDSLDGKRLGKITIRASVEPEYDALEVYVQYDSDGEWHKVGSIYNQNNRKKVSEFGFFPRKCDHYRIRLECRGKFTLYSIARQVEG